MYNNMIKIYKKQFEYIKQNKIVENKTKIIDKYGEIRLITFINPHYGWFGDNNTQINIKDIKEIINNN